jgi:hypothetical protein
MSDTSEVPAPPATPDEPTPVVTTASTTAAPETASTPASGASAEDETVTDSTTPETTSEDSDEDSTETAPEVVNTADGQHVVMPDGKKVYTRHHAYPISNAEWAQYEKTHAGDQERYRPAHSQQQAGERHRAGNRLVCIACSEGPQRSGFSNLERGPRNLRWRGGPAHPHGWEHR